MDALNHNTPQEDKNILRKLAKQAYALNKGKGVAVEVGSWVGGTAVVIAPFFEKLFCVDHFQGSTSDRLGPIGRQLGPEKIFRTFCKNVGEHLCEDIFVCRGSSEEWASVWNTPLDFVFIDADHTYQSVLQDIECWRLHVNPGGIICGHDYSELFPGVKRAVHESFTDFACAGQMWWTQQPNRTDAEEGRQGCRTQFV